MSTDEYTPTADDDTDAVGALADALDSATGGDRSWQWCVSEARRILVPLLAARDAEVAERIAQAIHALPGATRAYVTAQPGAYVTRDRAARIAREAGRA